MAIYVGVGIVVALLHILYDIVSDNELDVGAWVCIVIAWPAVVTVYLAALIVIAIVWIKEPGRVRWERN